MAIPAKDFDIHCSKHLRDQTFKALYLKIYWEKSFQIVALFSGIIVLNNAVVAEKNEQTFIFYITQRGITPQHKCIRAIAIMTFTLSNTFKNYNTVYCQISSWYGH